MFEKFMKKTSQYIETNNQFMRKIKATLQDQNTAIKNLETQMGQMVHFITGWAPSTLPSNTKINQKEHNKAITARIVQLPEIYVKMMIANEETIHSLDEEHM